jgi:hypothetical protein
VLFEEKGEKKLMSRNYQHKTAVFLYRNKLVIGYCFETSTISNLLYVTEQPRIRERSTTSFVKVGGGGGENLNFSKILKKIFLPSGIELFLPRIVDKMLYFTAKKSHMKADYISYN